MSATRAGRGTGASAGGGTSRIALSDEQQRVAQRLLSRADQHLQKLATISAARMRGPSGGCDTHAAQPAFVDLKTPRQSNCIGVFGRRGSGKTTVMVSVLDRLKNCQPNWRTIQQPLDLSYAPHEFPHGLTVIHWLYEVLRLHPEGHSGDATVRKAFDKTARSFFRGSDGFNRLVRDLAVSAEHYASAAAKEISERLNLRRDIQIWLDAQARAMDVEGFVIAIDDMDLTPANRHQSLIWSLLDELHQDRLFFLLGADLERLEQRLAEEDQFTRHGADAAAHGNAASHRLAAADLAYKVLPQVDRAELKPWSREQRSAFPPSSNGDSIANLADALALRPILREHLASLLPEWARGLENVHRELLQRHRDLQEAAANSASPDRDLDRIERELMGSLAESSFDFDLARKLRERALPEWAATFQWGAPSATVSATWDVLRQRLDRNEDLPELLPDEATCPLRIGLERARWAEVLLDVALDAQRLAPARLANRIPWLQARLSACEVALQRTQQSVDLAVEDDPGGMLAALYWLRVSDAPGNRLGWFALGLWPLLQWGAGDRPLWPQALGREVWTPERLARLARDAYRTTPCDDLAKAHWDALVRGQRKVSDVALLPQRTRDLLRVADALAGQVWAGLRYVDAQVGPPGLARLAAALAYRGLRASVTSLPRTNPELEALVRTLRDHAGGVEALVDDEIRQRFRAIDQQAEADREALRGDPAPLAEALRALLDAPWFRGLAV